MRVAVHVPIGIAEVALREVPLPASQHPMDPFDQRSDRRKTLAGIRPRLEPSPHSLERRLADRQVEITPFAVLAIPVVAERIPQEVQTHARFL